ncbi:MAG: DUF615 domain-containing protein [Desulfuromonadaceae bacterium]|nr:DUF615 domain-containing protein [Desulfuromonadaceae bacterium]
MSRDEKENDPSEPSRSALKRAAKAVEELAEQLAGLPPSQLARLALPEDVAAELRLVAKAAGHGARKRQIKHLAGLMRRNEEWTAKLQELLDNSDQVRYEDQKRFHRLESLRDRLCDPEMFQAAMEEIGGTFPAIDRELLARLAGSVHSSRDKRAFREIFRLLKNATETPESSPE